MQEQEVLALLLGPQHLLVAHLGGSGQVQLLDQVFLHLEQIPVLVVEEEDSLEVCL